MPRVLTSDQWADYLIYRLYPEQRVFFDGRSDFFGAALGSDYRKLQACERPWRELLERYRFQIGAAAARLGVERDARSRARLEARVRRISVAVLAFVHEGVDTGRSRATRGWPVTAGCSESRSVSGRSQ